MKEPHEPTPEQRIQDELSLHVIFDLKDRLGSVGWRLVEPEIEAWAASHFPKILRAYNERVEAARKEGPRSK